MEQAFFYLFSFLVVFSAIMVVTKSNVVHCALYLLLTFFSVAGLYILLEAEFIAAIQILVYAGAIIVLYLFAIFLINIEQSSYVRQAHRQRPFAIFVAILLCGAVYSIIKKSAFSPATGKYSANMIQQMGGNTKAVGEVLFTRFLFPFEVLSILLLVAMVGAIVLARRGGAQEGEEG